MFKGTFLAPPQYPELNEALRQIAEEYHCTKDTIAYSWLLKLPLSVQVITGTTDPVHIQSAAKAADIILTAKQWYKLYTSAGNRLP